MNICLEIFLHGFLTFNLAKGEESSPRYERDKLRHVAHASNSSYTCVDAVLIDTFFFLATAVKEKNRNDGAGLSDLLHTLMANCGFY